MLLVLKRCINNNLGVGCKVQGGQHVPSGKLAHKEVRPSVISETVSIATTIVGRQPDAEDDDDFEEEDGELQDYETVLDMRTENVSGLPITTQMVSFGTVIASSLGRVEVVMMMSWLWMKHCRQMLELLQMLESAIEIDHLLEGIHMGLLLVRLGM
ncbi:hypothetical protein NE237_018467 [Protea cynaroides]|uniref:Uncharacterized protein n=1 Tax=Protea cynaroides TaxID=273540 RepID=A0A9Q0K9Y4_9MAGN|nr:hypothetical protein NE237_018467 [Protea cynaroides]